MDATIIIRMHIYLHMISVRMVLTYCGNVRISRGFRSFFMDVIQLEPIRRAASFSLVEKENTVTFAGVLHST